MMVFSITRIVPISDERQEVSRLGRDQPDSACGKDIEASSDKTKQSPINRVFCGKIIFLP